MLLYVLANTRHPAVRETAAVGVLIFHARTKELMKAARNGMSAKMKSDYEKGFSFGEKEQAVKCPPRNLDKYLELCPRYYGMCDIEVKVDQRPGPIRNPVRVTGDLVLVEDSEQPAQSHHLEG